MALRVKLYRKHDVQGHVAGTGKVPVMVENSHPDNNSSFVEEEMPDDGISTPRRQSERLRCVGGD